MPPKVEKLPPVDVVEIDSSDDEDDNVTSKTPNGSSSINPISQLESGPMQEQRGKATTAPMPVHDYQSVEARSFWKAGAYEVGPIARTTVDSGELEHARVHPKFLHSNATSHKWAFGAIAELLDNAVDEIHNGATYVKVDKLDVMRDNSPALLFQDDGGGMNPDSIRKCMSLGYSSKKSNTTIGQYGNGFKTSTMRLGADVIVFSRATQASKATQSVGLLSYTFLCRTGQDDVIVPMIDFDISSHWAEPIIYGSQDDWSSNLKMILEWSPFTSKDELMKQFEDIGLHGTKIIIYNLWLNDEGIYELSFDDDDEDIRLRDEANSGGQTKLRKNIVELQSHISYRIRYSLRAYASMLYLRKFRNFSIILRGKPVQQYNSVDDLKYQRTVTYRPQLGGVISNEVTVETTIGFIKEAPGLQVCGFNVYHKNRLIRPFWKVTGDGSSVGGGVVGVLEANFIEPAHDKQDFERSSLFIRLEAKLKQILLEYWRKHCHLIGRAPYVSSAKRQTGYTAKTLQPTTDQEEMHLDQLTAVLPANLPHMNCGELGSHGQINFPIEQPVISSAAASCEEIIVEDDQGSLSVDQICEENIQLFLRCEEYRQKENEIKNTIEELEKELEQAKRKCAQLSAHVESKRKQKMMKQQIEEVS